MIHFDDAQLPSHFELAINFLDQISPEINTLSKLSNPKSLLFEIYTNSNFDHNLIFANFLENHPILRIGIIEIPR